MVRGRRGAVAGCGSSSHTAPLVSGDLEASDAGGGTAVPESGPLPEHAACSAPTGAWTGDVGGTVPIDLTWTGLNPSSDQTATVHVADDYDCDGSRHVNALYINNSSTWCAACVLLAEDLQRRETSWKALGIRVLWLLQEDDNHNPASMQTVIDWRKRWSLEWNSIAVDDQLALKPDAPGTPPLPTLYLVDPRTMQVVDVQFGLTGDYTKIEALARKNQVP